MDVVIAAEVESSKFYRDVAAKVADESMKILFLQFAEEEQQHATSMKNIKEMDIEDFSFCEGAGYKISQTCMVGDYKISEGVQMPKLSADMKPVDAIALAMKKEEEAMKTYSSLAEVTDDPAKKHVFAQLAKMEEAHKVKIEDLYTNAAFGEVW
ncbi:MAG: conserved hypothetical cytosolic protein [Bacteroidetes bacterium]|nr:conserved hypothetical cytosolic protein [Bacteroidota bacterium]